MLLSYFYQDVCDAANFKDIAVSGFILFPLLTFIKKDKSSLHIPEGCYGFSEEIRKN